MTVYRVTVEREEPSRLAKKMWRYAYVRAALMLDQFVTYERPTTRHKYRATGVWANHHRGLGSDMWGVPKIDRQIPRDVAEEARDTWVAESLQDGVEGIK